MPGWFDRSNSEQQKLSAQAHQRFSIYLGAAKAEEVANDVRTGAMTADDAEQWSLSVESLHEAGRNRPDIERKDWQAFEEGWRPDGG